jgi:hypothetical protein
LPICPDVMTEPNMRGNFLPTRASWLRSSDHGRVVEIETQSARSKIRATAAAHGDQRQCRLCDSRGKVSPRNRLEFGSWPARSLTSRAQWVKMTEGLGM